MGQFGDKFRKAREKKGVSLDDASNVTKIGSRMLQAIEEEQFDQLPGGVFNKGFIRAYAKYLGINDQEAVTEYLDCLRQEQVRAQAVWEPQARPAAPEKRVAANASVRASKPVASKPASPVVQTDELPELQLPRAEHVRPPHQKYLDRGRDPGMPWRLIAATVVVLLLATVLWRRHAIGNADARPPQASSSTSGQISTSQPSGSTQNVSATSNSAETASGNGGAAPNSSSQLAASAGSNPTSNGAAANGSNSNPALVKTPSASSGDDNEVITRSFVTTPAKVAEKPALPLVLIIRANENSWISVSADGKSVSQETLIAPAHTSIRASREIVAKVGNAAGVTFLWDGKEIPAEGNEAETKTFVFDAQGMRVVPAGNPANQTP